METFTMSRKEVLRAGLVRAALAGKITNAEGAGALHLTVRQFKRLKARVRTEGVAGLPHRARGRPGRRHLGADLREQVVTLMTTVYDGFNDVHLTEKLRERHALPVSRATVRRLRLALGRPARRRRRAPKHRIERLWATLQDRLTSELRLRGIATLEAANAYLPEFLADFQRRFPTPPASPTAAWRPAPCDLELILSCRYRRVVARDNTVQLGGRWLQVPPGPGGASYAGRRLEVRELLDGRLVVMLDGRPLVTQPSPSPDFVLTPRTAPSADRRPHAASPDPRRLLRQAPAQPATPRAAPRTPPPPRHPWRQAFKRETRLSHPIKG